MGYKWKSAETCAAVITTILALVFALLLGLTWFRGLLLLDLGDGPEMVDESVDPLANFARFTCPKHYRQLEQYIQYKDVLLKAATQAPTLRADENSTKSRAKKAVQPQQYVPRPYGPATTSDSLPKELRLKTTKHLGLQRGQNLSLGPKQTPVMFGPLNPTSSGAIDDGNSQYADASTAENGINVDDSGRNLTQTERFRKWFLAQCEFRDALKAQVMQVPDLENQGPGLDKSAWYAFWRQLLSDYFGPLGGFRYVDLVAEQAKNLSAKAIWHTAGRLARDFNLPGSFEVGPAPHLLSATSMIHIVEPLINIPDDVVSGPENSPEMNSIIYGMKSAHMSLLTIVGPLLMEGSGKEFNSTDAEQFYDQQLNMVAALTVAQAKMLEPEAAEDKRKYSMVQPTVVAEQRKKTWTLGKLAARYPHIKWHAFFEGMRLPNLHDKMPVFVMSPIYFDRLNKFIGENGDMALRMMRAEQIVMLLNKLVQMSLVDCKANFAALMPHVEAFAYINAIPRLDRESTVRDIRQMIKPIVEEYKAVIMESDWLSQKSKEKLRDKVKSMTINVGWPNWYGLDSERTNGTLHAIDRYHKSLFDAFRAVEPKHSNITSDPEYDLVGYYDAIEARYMDWLVAMQRISLDKDYAGVDKKVDPHVAMRPNDMNAHYVRTENSFSIAYAWIQNHFDAEKLVESYGKMGLTIAHEIGHGFDHNGINHGSDGKLVANLLDTESAQNYDLIQACLIDRYAKECCPSQAANFTKPCADGWLTQDENFADISGVTIAYRAFKRRQRLLQGGHFELSKRKFWVAYGDMWCREVFTDASLTLIMSTDPHPPDECRVNVVTRSVPQFRRDFGAKRADDKLDARHQRCYLWNVK